MGMILILRVQKPITASSNSSRFSSVLTTPKASELQVTSPPMPHVYQK